MGQVADNLAAVQRRIELACERAGRGAGSVRLLPVSKTHGLGTIKEAYDAGVRIFGENKAQEAAQKAAHLAALPDLRWAVIGHLQTNKAKLIAPFAAEFHALDSLKVAEALDRRLQAAGRSLEVFVQVNSSGEPQKFGLAPDEVPRFAGDLARYDTLRVRGLMTLALFSTDQDAVGACFARMAELHRQLRDLEDLPGEYAELSMGMSGDFELAISYGATTVRVGEAIFGSRLAPQDYWPD